MSVLTVVQEVCKLTSNAVPTVAVTSTDTHVKEMLAMLPILSEEIGQRAQWPQIIKTGTITLVDGTASYAMPTDMREQIFDTTWDNTNKWPLNGQLSPQQWEIVQRGIIATGPRKNFRLWGSNARYMYLQPTPGTGDAGTLITFEYYSTNFILPQTWVSGQVFTAASYCTYMGNIYYTTLGGTAGATPPTWTTGTQSDGAVSWTYRDMAYTSILSDSDQFIVGDNLMKLALRYKFLENKNLNSNQAKIDFELAFDRYVLQYNGSRTLNLAPVSGTIFITERNIPTGYISI